MAIEKNSLLIIPYLSFKKLDFWHKSTYFLAINGRNDEKLSVADFHKEHTNENPDDLANAADDADKDAKGSR